MRGPEKVLKSFQLGGIQCLDCLFCQRFTNFHSSSSLCSKSTNVLFADIVFSYGVQLEVWCALYKNTGIIRQGGECPARSTDHIFVLVVEREPRELDLPFLVIFAAPMTVVIQFRMFTPLIVTELPLLSRPDHWVWTFWWSDMISGGLGPPDHRQCRTLGNCFLI